MVKQDVIFSDGTRIFYEEVNGILHRFIEYAYSPQEKQLLQEIKDNPYLKEQIDKLVRKHKATKYYCLLKLDDIHRRLDEEQNEKLCDELEELCKKVGTEYDSKIVNEDILHTFGKYCPGNEIQCAPAFYCPGNEIQCAAFFTTIYLAMLDMEKKKMHNPTCEGKYIVYDDCEIVLLGGLSIEDIIIMSKRNAYYDEYYYEDLVAIADAFDGFPEATWNVD